MIRRIVMGIAAATGVAVFAGTASNQDHTDRNDAGQIVDPGGLGVQSIQVGDCIQLPDQKLIASVEGVPCSAPHDAQVFAEFEVTGPDDFDTSVVNGLASAGCSTRFDRAGIDPRSLQLLNMTPVEEGWVLGDRQVLCLLVRFDRQPLSGSALGG